MLVHSLLALTALASDPCSKAKITTDKATKETIIHFGGPDWQIDHTIGGTTYSSRMFRSGLTKSTLKTGAPLTVALEDGDATRLRLSEPATARTHTDETGSFTQWQAVFTVSPDNIEKLANAPMTATKIDLGQGQTSTPVAKGKGKKLQAAFQCIASQM